ncbi:MAG: hypothetical protein ILO34_05605 [Kiritimatiellae bacterium]|nr:hypothetical protein [Kiritimatiellia bacterium]
MNKLRCLAAAIAAIAASAAFSQTLKVMPLGDSITWGYGGSQSGYRYFLYRDLVADGYGVDYIGDTQSEYASAAALPDHDHSGHSGWCITTTGISDPSRGSILANIDGWMASLADPDVVLLLLGTNDTASNDMSDRADALDELISKIVTNAPGCHVIVASVLERTDNASYDAAVQQYVNAYIPGIVQNHVNAGEHVHYLDMRSELVSSTDLMDGLHPNDGGYQKMADAWRGAIESIFPLSAEPEGYQENVPFTEWDDFSLVYEFTPAQRNPTYTKDNHLALAAANPAGPTRVAYYVEYVKSAETATNYVWVSFDSPTNDLACIGLPANGTVFQDDVANMNVFCNVTGVATGTKIQTGNIEFWQYTYDGGCGRGDIGGSASEFDFDDVINNNYTVDYGSMQIHNHAAGSAHTIFSYSAWNHAQFTGALGIGSRPSSDPGYDSDPDWTFAQNVDTAYSYKKIQVFASFEADTYAPAISSASISADHSTVTVKFSEKIDSSCVDASAFTSQEFAASSATLGSDQKTVTLSGVLAAGNPATVTITATGIADLAGNTASPLSTTFDVIYFGYEQNVPSSEWSDYTLVYEFSPELWTPAYTVDNTATVPSSFDRVAYYMEYRKTPVSPVEYVWVSFDDISGGDTSKIGIPANGVVYRQTLTDMNVYCNVSGVTTGTGITTGNIEFWQYNYSANGGIGLGGDDGAFDFDDACGDGGSHTSMQIHNYGAQQTLFSYSGSGSGVGGIGIGNRPVAERVNNDADWTFAQNANSFVHKKVQVLIRRTGDATPPTVDSVSFSPENSTVTVTFSEMVTTASANLANFSFTGFSPVSAAISSDRKSIVFAGSPVDRAENMSVEVANVQDLSFNTIVADEIAFIAPYRGAEWNVPAAERELYQLVYEFTPASYHMPSYSVNNAYRMHTRPGRIAYYMEIQATADTPVKYVWVSMPSFAETAEETGIPSGYVQRGLVEDMNVYCNVDGVPTGTGIDTGNIEFWPYTYTVANSGIAGLEGANPNMYDFNDEMTEGGMFGSMQIHDWSTGTTLFSYSGFTYSAEAAGSVGIGNNPDPSGSSNLDWTFARNVATTYYAKIQVYVMPDAGSAASDTAIVSGTVADGGYSVLSVKGSVSKTGSGDLVAGGVYGLASNGAGFDGTSALAIGAGRLVIPAEEAATGSIDDGAWIHLDASAADTIVRDGSGNVIGWNDVRASGGHNATAIAPYEAGQTDYYMCVAYPTLVENALDDKSVVDLGHYSYHDASNPSGDTVSPDAAALVFDSVPVREGFMVVRFKDAGSETFLLGHRSVWYLHPGLSGELLSANNANGWAKEGVWRVDGVQVDPLNHAVGTNGFHVISFAFDVGLDVDALTLDRAIRAGGIEIAEMVLFRNQMNNVRWQAIESALMEKWLGREHPVAEVPAHVDSVVFQSGTSLVAGRDVEIGSLTANGTFSKSGDGDVSAQSYSGITGVEISGGSLSPAVPAPDTSEVDAILADAYLHLDPSEEDTLWTQQDGSVAGIYDVRTTAKYAEKTAQSGANATVVENWSNGLPGLDFGNIWINGETGGSPTDTTACGFKWFARSDSVRTVFAVVEKKTSRDTFLFGDFHDGSAGDTYQFHADMGTLIYSVHSNGNLHNGLWTVDGNRVDAPLSYPWTNDGVHIIAARSTGNVSAGTIAQDRSNPTCRVGGMRYGEVIVFERALSDVEFAEVNNYLISKWGGSTGSFSSFDIASGSRFAHSCEMGILDGATLELGYPFAALAPVSVDGRVSLGTGVTVEIVSSGDVRGGMLPLVSATSIGDPGNLSTWTVSGPDETPYRLVIENGTVYLDAPIGGLYLIVK